ncbi:MAG TPA: response regulator transcription factor [Thermomicrobiales bacterium]|jgi:DNA-binding NarL/FixJ family response regulator|nr:response regulator transcription factor [Thermomicrobiales bacterium]
MATSGSIRILIVDDHPVVRDGIRGMLAADPSFAVVGEAADGEAAVRLATEIRPDVVLMDLRMPVMDGATATGRIVGDGLSRVVVLTTYDTDADIVRAVEAGASGYVLKDAPREEVFRAIRAAAAVKAVLAPEIAHRLMARVRTPTGQPLSEREMDVLRLVARGTTNAGIAAELRVSEATVKSHLVHAFRKLNVPDRTSAVIALLKRGDLSLDEVTVPGDGQPG